MTTPNFQEDYKTTLEGILADAQAASDKHINSLEVSLSIVRQVDGVLRGGLTIDKKLEAVCACINGAREELLPTVAEHLRLIVGKLESATDRMPATDLYR